MQNIFATICAMMVISMAVIVVANSPYTVTTTPLAQSTHAKLQNAPSPPKNPKMTISNRDAVTIAEIKAMTDYLEQYPLPVMRKK